MSTSKFFFVIVCCVILSQGFSQRTTIYTDPSIEFKNGVELFDKKLFNAAQSCFLHILETTRDKNSLIRSDAEFFAAACAMELFHKDAEWRFKAFIENNPASNRNKWAYFYLGKSNFRKKKYSDVIQWLEKVDVYDLKKEDLAELYFKRGYSYFETGNYEKAKIDLNEIKDYDNRYANPANYYFSHIAYCEKNYETAALGFRRLLNNETFGSIVPFYIFKIYFVQEKYDSVISLAPMLLNDTSKILKRSEISKIVGESYYRRKEYPQSIPYLLEYGGVTQDDNYELGFALYNVGKKHEAVSYFSNAVSGNDTIAQSAWYHLADCRLQEGERKEARNAFYQAFKIGPNGEIKEDALFGFAKLSYELSLTPYNEAIVAFTDYINTYPQSPRKDEAYKYLTNVFASTQNYLEAMKAIDKIKNADLSLKTIYQRMAWYQGIRHFNSGDLDSARYYFSVAAQNGYDARINALTAYWDAEIDYRQKKYESAISKFKSFQIKAAAPSLPEFDLANYSLAYCFFNQKQYSSARNYFDLFLKKNNGAEKMADAAARLGDCWFMLGNFSSASDEYEHAVHLGKTDNEYCLYQKAICSGREKKYQEKINDLKSLMEQFPNSSYLKGSHLEIAESYIRDNQYDKAIEWYKNYLIKFPNSGQENSINAQIGVLYMNKNDNDKALEYFLNLINHDPKCQESQLTALPNVKSILLSQGKTDEWEKIANENGIAVNKDEIEDATYQKARDQFVIKKNCDLSLTECEKYVTRFPDGPHIQEIQFWRGECSFSKNDFATALNAYLYLTSLSNNSFTEVALTKAAFIHFKNQQYEEALPLYVKLQTTSGDPVVIFNAKVNAMRCGWNAKNYVVASEQATLVINDSKAKQDQVAAARKIRAASYYFNQNYSASMDDYKVIAKTAENVDGAEAYYYIASIQFKSKNCKEVEKTIDKLMGYKYSTKYWMTKGLLLMSDCYIEQKKYADAEALLHTIIDNQPEESLLEEANKKLEEVTRLQQSRTIGENSNEQESKRVEFPSKENERKLFEETFELQQMPLDSTKIISPK
jgi:TolA-binding protein